MATGRAAVIPIESAGAIVLLALTDSLSFGTLLVPVWLLTTPGRVRLARMFAYLAVIAATYFALGVALIAGGRFLVDAAGDIVESTPALIARLLVGVGLFALSFALDTRPARAHAARRAEQGGRLRRWRDQAMGGNGSLAALAGLAIAAVAAEVASMLPYLAATGIIAAQTSGWESALLILAAYCLVMIAPALVLTGASTTARTQLELPLARLDSWLTRNARSTTLWIIGIAGFLLAGTAITALGWIPS